MVGAVYTLKRSSTVKMSRADKQCWRCKCFSDNLPEHFKAIASASGQVSRFCTRGKKPSEPVPCPQFMPLGNKKEKAVPFKSEEWGRWKKADF